MLKKLVLLLFFFACIIFRSAYAQPLVPRIEGWRVHASFVTNTCVEEVEDKMYVGNASAMFTFNKEEGSTEVISRVNGLSDVTIKFIRYHKQSRTVIVGYDNLNIDLIQNGVVYNIPDIKNKLIIGEKTLNNICLYENTAYLACSFGIVVVDVPRKRLVDSYVNLGSNGTNLAVNDIEVYAGGIYASSGTGIYRASLNSLNLSDYNFWTRTTITAPAYGMEVFKGQLYAVVSRDTVKYYDGITWTVSNDIPAGEVSDMRYANNTLVIAQREQLCVLPAQGAVVNKPHRFIISAMLSREGDIYMFTNEQFFIREDRRTGALEYIAPSGPYGTTATRMTYGGEGKLWVAGGGVNGLGSNKGWDRQFNNTKFYRFENNQWFSYKGNPDTRIEEGRDFIDVAVHPSTGNAFFASFGHGILEIKGDNVVNAYDSSNSTLRALNTGEPGPVRVSGVTFDSEENMWVSNFGAVNPLSVRTSAGTWKSFPFGVSIDARIGFITCDDQDNKWIFSTRGLGIVVYNSGKTPLDATDDRIQVLTKDKKSGFLPSNTVLCVTKDQKGEMWVGTDQGLCIFSNPENIFKPGADYDARQIVIKTGLVYSNFLGSTAINCIKVDAANRKWIGTANGAWLVSADGYTVIRNFDMSNSPLLSNTILEIGIEEKTGEVFFATEKGLISYMGTATEAGDRHGDVLVYPNPVRPDYNGLIAIKGLVSNAYVKITDISGHLVYETRANGGMATWDGRNFTGKRAATGVYLVYSSNESGEETHVTKILFVN
jgi:hypothetical protein